MKNASFRVRSIAISTLAVLGAATLVAPATAAPEDLDDHVKFIMIFRNRTSKMQLL